MMLRKLFFNYQYLRRPSWDTGITPPELVEFMDNHLPGRALDLGCGTGTNAIELARRGWHVTGVDFARRAISAARLRAGSAGVQVDFLVGDVPKPAGLEGKFDLILDIGCLHSLSANARSRYIANLSVFLSEGGSYMLYAFLRYPDQQAIGLSETDIQHLLDNFRIVSRQDGTERGQRPSAWFIFESK